MHLHDRFVALELELDSHATISRQVAKEELSFGRICQLQVCGLWSAGCAAQVRRIRELTTRSPLLLKQAQRLRIAPRIIDAAVESYTECMRAAPRHQTHDGGAGLDTWKQWVVDFAAVGDALWKGLHCDHLRIT